MLRSLPNILTISRIIIIPVILLCYYFGNSPFYHQLAAVLFASACITDFLDGYLARYYNNLSNFGRVLDPIADKLLVASVIVVLVSKSQVSLLPSIAIICREILVSGLREFLAELKISIPVSNLAKIKTGAQMGAIFFLLLGNAGSGINFIPLFGEFLIWVAAILTVITGYAYVKAGINHLSIINH
jgi:cardiolipin synthase (CMP-forming)